MADNSLLNMFDPYNSGNAALPQSEPSTPVHATHAAADNEGRTPLTLSTFFNRAQESKRPLSVSPKRPDFASHAHQPLVQIDESLLYDPDINPEEFENSDCDSRSQSRQHTADDLLETSIYGHMSVRGHPVLGASTSSLDSISLRDIGMSFNNSTTTSLLRIPAPPQIEQQLRDRADSLASTNTDTSTRGRKYGSDGSCSVDISVPEASYLLDEPALLYNQQTLDDDSSVNLGKVTPHFSTLPRRNRLSHVVLEDSSWIGGTSISPLQSPKSLSPAHGEETPPESSPILTPSPRKSRFAFIRRDKDSTPTAAAAVGLAGPTPVRSASKPPSTTPRSTSPLQTPSRQQVSGPSKSSSFLNLLRGSPQESGKRSTPKAVTPAPSKPPTPVESSPASTVTSTNGRSGSDGLETPPDELGFHPTSPVRSVFASHVRSESKSPVRAESKSPIRRESKSPERPLLSRAASKSTIFTTSSASATSTRLPSADVQTKASPRRFSIRPVNSSSSSLATAASRQPPSSSSSSGGTRLSLSTKPSTIAGISSRTSSVVSRRVPASQVTPSAPAPRSTTSPFKVPPAPRPPSTGTVSTVTAKKVASSAAPPATSSAAARISGGGTGPFVTSATPTRRPASKIIPSLRPRSMIVTGTSSIERTTAPVERKPPITSSRTSIGSSSSSSRLSVAPSSSSSRTSIAPSSSGPRVTTTSSVSASRLGAAGSRLSTVLSTSRRGAPPPSTTTTTNTVRGSSGPRSSIVPGPGAMGPPPVERGVSHMRSRSAITTSVSTGAIGPNSKTTTVPTTGASIARSNSMIFPGAGTSRLSNVRRTLVKPPPASATSKK